MGENKCYNYNSESKTLTIHNTIGFLNWEKDGKEGIEDLKKLVMPGNVILDNNAFQGCKNLISLEAKGGTGEVSILNQTFKDCKNLKYVDIPNVTVIGREAFAGCSLIEELDLPKVEKIGKDAFKGCTSLKLTVGQELRDSYDILDSGYERIAQYIKEINKIKLKDDNEKATEYKSFKATCKNMCEKGVADYGTAKSLLRIVFENVDKGLSSLSKFIGDFRNPEIRGEFNDFKGIITKFDTVSAKIGAAKNQQELRSVVDGSVKAFQSELKSYVVEKFKYLTKAGFDSTDMEKIYFDKFFRVLLGIAGVRKGGSVSSNKTYSSFGLGGGGMDLLVKVKECELKGK